MEKVFLNDFKDSVSPVVDIFKEFQYEEIYEISDLPYSEEFKDYLDNQFIYDNIESYSICDRELAKNFDYIEIYGSNELEFGKYNGRIGNILRFEIMGPLSNDKSKEIFPNIWQTHITFIKKSGRFSKKIESYTEVSHLYNVDIEELPEIFKMLQSYFSENDAMYNPVLDTPKTREMAERNSNQKIPFYLNNSFKIKSYPEIFINKQIPDKFLDFRKDLYSIFINNGFSAGYSEDIKELDLHDFSSICNELKNKIQPVNDIHDTLLPPRLVNDYYHIDSNIKNKPHISQTIGSIELLGQEIIDRDKKSIHIWKIRLDSMNLHLDGKRMVSDLVKGLGYNRDESIIVENEIAIFDVYNCGHDKIMLIAQDLAKFMERVNSKPVTVKKTIWDQGESESEIYWFSPQGWKKGKTCSACGEISDDAFCSSCGTKNSGDTLILSKMPEWIKMNGSEFEIFISSLLEKIGYVEVVNRSHAGDGGIDIQATERGVLTSSKIGIECKNQPNGTIGREVIQKLDSALKYENFTKGIVITTGTFSSKAVEYASNVNISLIDGERLQEIINEKI